ncbi:MAG: hypothetical protein ACRELB_07655 [Polyangiaceae bacterium]
MSTNIKQTSTSRAIVALNLPGPVPALITYAQTVIKGLTNSPHFPTTTPTLAVLNGAINALIDGENAALTRVKGAVVQRNAARKALVQQMQLLKANVQSAADGDPDNALTIIESAGMSVRKPTVRKPRVFAATPAATSGSVKLLAASAGPRTSYEWEYSTDGGKTWIAAPPSIQAKTTIPGLAAGTTVKFRYRAITPKTGAEDWSAPVALLVK